VRAEEHRWHEQFTKVYEAVKGKCRPTREELLEAATSDDAKRAVKTIIKSHRQLLCRVIKNNRVDLKDWTERRDNLQTLLSLPLGLYPASLAYALEPPDLTGASSLAAAVLAQATLLNDNGDKSKPTSSLPACTTAPAVAPNNTGSLNAISGKLLSDQPSAVAVEQKVSMSDRSTAPPTSSGNAADGCRQYFAPARRGTRFFPGTCCLEQA
jgi:hypothetical protein